MPFDAKNPVDLALLKSELDVDPVSIGYGTANGTTAIVLSMLNDSDKNTTNATTTRPLDEIKVSEVSTVINSAEFSALTEFQKIWVEMFINRSDGTSIKDYKAGFLSIFLGGSATRAAAAALQQKDASRAEELFGVNTVITRNDFIQARES